MSNTSDLAVKGPRRGWAAKSRRASASCSAASRRWAKSRAKEAPEEKVGGGRRAGGAAAKGALEEAAGAIKNRGVGKLVDNGSRNVRRREGQRARGRGPAEGQSAQASERARPGAPLRGPAGRAVSFFFFFFFFLGGAALQTWREPPPAPRYRRERGRVRRRRAGPALTPRSRRRRGAGGALEGGCGPSAPRAPPARVAAVRADQRLQVGALPERHGPLLRLAERQAELVGPGHRVRSRSRSPSGRPPSPAAALSRHRRRIDHQHRPLHRAAQLADVARPVVARQRLHQLARGRCGRARRANCRWKCATSSGMSSRRSRSAGTRIRTTFSR